MNELCTKGAGELAQMVRTGEVASIEVVEAHLDRITEVNPSVNAVTVTLAEAARSAAAEVDRAVAAGEAVGPLAGVPFTVKENIDVAGSATTWGVSAFSGQVAPVDAPAVARLREAGAIPLARTNLPDFAFRWDTESDIAGRTLNPWDPTRAVGGSSGGEAAALATGMTPLGLGNDLGGSLRVPAQMCGVASLRPSRGRVAHAAATQPWPEPISMQLTNCQGPMGRSVADLRRALDLLSAPDLRDPRWVPAPLEGVGGGGPRRVAVVTDPAGLGIDAHVRAGVERAAGWLVDAGYEVVEAEPPRIADAAAVWMDAIWADVGMMWPNLEPVAGANEIEMVNSCLAQGMFRHVDQATQMGVLTELHQIAADWAAFMVEYPLVLSPVCCERAWAVGDDITRVAEIGAAMRMVIAVNVLGLPSCAVPVGCDDDLPQGVQVIGPRFEEYSLLDAGQAIEDRAPALTPIEPRVAEGATSS